MIDEIMSMETRRRVEENGIKKNNEKRYANEATAAADYCTMQWLGYTAVVGRGGGETEKIRHETDGDDNGDCWRFSPRPM